ncbi:MAG TPA: nucleobase:cation symporter-2 family protein [Dermatophilaceae bacterium]|nr:nucleobase:cation symporter-2 family protein [Dermatophilaceae bacterium]
MTAVARDPQVHPVDERLPTGRLATLGLQHVLVMYAGAVAVPLIVGGALKLTPEQIAMLVSADLFACGIATLIQSWGVTRWFGIKLPVMMGVTFAAVSPMLVFAAKTPGVDGARGIFGAIIGAGIVSILIAPLVSKLLRFFPPVVTGSIITVIGVTLMRVGIQWAMNNLPAASAQTVDSGKLADAVEKARTAAQGGAVTIPSVPMQNNPLYGDLGGLGVSAFVLIVILLLVKYGKGFISNIAVLLGIIAGSILAAALGKMSFTKVGEAAWFQFVTPFAFGAPTFDAIMILTMSIVMIVVMIESTGMFLALSDMTGKKIGQPELAAGLRTDGVGTLIGGIFNTFPYTSFSQNVGLVGVTGVRSRWVTITGGIILLLLGLIPKIAALVAAIPTVVLGGAGLVMFGMVAATGIRILSNVDFKTHHNSLYVVAISIGFGLVPLVAPRWSQWMPERLTPLLDSGILLTAISAVLLNLYFNGAHEDTTQESIEAAKASEA